MSLPAHATRLDVMDGAWRVGPAGARLDAVRTAALALKEQLHKSPPARSIRTYDLITLPYPTRYGLCDAHSSLLPYLMITNRMQLVTFTSSDGPKRLLVNPSDHERDAETPFFKRITDKMPGFVNRMVAKRHGEVPGRLAEAGVRGDQIDYVTFDHLHTQDLRRVMLEWCPRAKLLLQKEELAIFERLHPLQHDWYVADSLRGIAPERIIPLDGDYLLGDGVALVRTPGHTLGNHSIVLGTERGLWTISENGVAADNYSPERSEIGGVAASARGARVEVILNANTRELSLEQYTSMVLEKTLADVGVEGWPQVFNSSELTPSALSPGLAPTFAHKGINSGVEPA